MNKPDDALYDTTREYEEMDVGEPSGNEPVRVLRAYMTPCGIAEFGYHGDADTILPWKEDAPMGHRIPVAILSVTDTGVGGLEPWMVEVLKKYAKHYDGNVKLELLPIAAAIERILKEVGDE